MWILLLSFKHKHILTGCFFNDVYLLHRFAWNITTGIQKFPKQIGGIKSLVQILQGNVAAVLLSDHILKEIDQNRFSGSTITKKHKEFLKFCIPCHAVAKIFPHHFSFIRVCN